MKRFSKLELMAYAIALVAAIATFGIAACSGSDQPAPTGTSPTAPATVPTAELEYAPGEWYVNVHEPGSRIYFERDNDCLPPDCWSYVTIIRVNGNQLTTPVADDDLAAFMRSGDWMHESLAAESVHK